MKCHDWTTHLFVTLNPPPSDIRSRSDQSCVPCSSTSTQVICLCSRVLSTTYHHTYQYGIVYSMELCWHTRPTAVLSRSAVTQTIINWSSLPPLTVSVYLVTPRCSSSTSFHLVFLCQNHQQTGFYWSPLTEYSRPVINNSSNVFHTYPRLGYDSREHHSTENNCQDIPGTS